MVMQKKKLGGLRALKSRVKTAKGRKISSTRWLSRQLNDRFVISARAEGYRSRAAYKLLEIDDKFKLFRPGQSVVELGASPGSWTQIITQKLKSPNSGSKIVAVDLNPMDSLPNIEFIEGDFLEDKTLDKINQVHEGRFDLILSDMAPNTTGHKGLDNLRTIALCEHVLEFAGDKLLEGGAIIAKIFHGEGEKEFLDAIKLQFKKFKMFKPKSSRKESSEIYLVAQGFSGKKCLQGTSINLQ
jgi:23S rRNA (uridine2552-2'-O)-methyltransferase